MSHTEERFSKCGLPAEIGIVPMDEGTDELDIDTLDFFSDPNYRVTILEREQRRCFYTW